MCYIWEEFKKILVFIISLLIKTSFNHVGNLQRNFTSYIKALSSLINSSNIVSLVIRQMQKIPGLITTRPGTEKEARDLLWKLAEPERAPFIELKLTYSWRQSSHLILYRQEGTKQLSFHTTSRNGNPSRIAFFMISFCSTRRKRMVIFILSIFFKYKNQRT